MQASFARFADAVALLRHIPVSGGAMSRHLAICVLGGLLVSAALGEAQAVPNATPGPAPAQQLKTYHDGSIRDISAIGNRNVGCDRGLGNWYTLEKQVAMGKQFAQEVELINRLVLDPVVTEYVNRLGQNLVRNSDARMPFTIKVIKSDEINAFGLPGGFFYVNSGLLLAADNEAELAGVMAHEIAHVAACHAARAQTRGALAKLATISLIFVGGSIAYAAANAANLALPVTFMKFSRSFEAEADYLGVQYVYQAGYDPQAFVSFFERIAAEEGKKRGFLARTFMTHPPTSDRVKKIQQEIAALLPPKAEYILDSSEFEDVKFRLAALENRHRLENHRPTLGRRAQKPSDGQHPNNDDDERPTLKRRN